MALTDFQSYKFTFEEVCPTLEEMFTFLQLPKAEEEHPGNLFVNDILPELHTNGGITGGYRILPVDEIRLKEGVAVIANTELCLGRQVCGYIKKSTSMALFLCTAGDFFTQMTDHYNQRGDLLEAFIVDAIGSMIVESAMDKIQESLLKDMQAAHLGISNRYSPGYCNWHLSEQKTLFQLIGENPIDVRLSESCLMQPIKSVSGVIGIGEQITKSEYGCATCNSEHCIYRRIKNR